MQTVNLEVPLTGLGIVDESLKRFNDLNSELEALLKGINPDELEQLGIPSLTESFEALNSEYTQLVSKRNELEEHVSTTRNAIQSRSRSLERAREIIASMLQETDKAMKQYGRE